MVELTNPEEKSASPEITEKTIPMEDDLIFPFPVSNTENKLVLPHVMPPTPQKIRVTFTTILGKERILHLPGWLHDLVGWGIFLVILVGFFAIQVYLNRLLSGSLNQFVLCLTVIVEMGLLWRWDQFWY